jgi:hypothetical protein
MRTRTIVGAWIFLALTASLLPACGSSSKPAGTEGGACYGNDSCNAGLSCLSHLCVDASGFVAPGGDAGNSDASAADAVADTTNAEDAMVDAGDAGPPAPTIIIGACGIGAHSQGCSDCLNMSCCSAGAACLSLQGCAMCISGLLSGQVCTSDALYTAWQMCAAVNCSILCGG